MNKLLPAMLILALLAGCEEDEDLPEQCLLEPEPGTCEALIPGYYYDPDTGQCGQFIWGGCGGVVPFHTMSECEEVCE